ncbi:MAG TPA: hypothetical protein VG713_16350 [Pirellulales bacterium]|nr:hypothetical protein [Pirellulales bacterium]
MRRVFFFVLATVVAQIASAQDFICYPMINGCQPMAAQIGTTSEHTIDARYGLGGAFEVLVSGAGVTGEVIDNKDKAKADSTFYTKAKLRFAVADDALPGVRDFRVATPQGASTLGQLVIVRDRVVAERAKNDTVATAEVVDVPAAICGTIEKAEDVDFYKFHAVRGMSLVFQVNSARCEDRIHDMQTHVDPILTLRNSQGTVVAMSDNFFRADPLLVHKFDSDGDYFLEIRDVRYQGSPYWQYVIQVHDRPLVTNVMPMALTPGKQRRVEMIGFNLPEKREIEIAVPAELAEGPRWLDLPLKNQPADPVPVVISRLPLVEASGKNLSREAAQSVTAPVGINGRIANDNQMHYFAFDAKKGERFNLTVVARSHESALDPVLSIYNEKGSRLVENDDHSMHRLTNPDAKLVDWSAPADGRYTVELRDLQWQGGPQFVYFLSIEPSEPGFDLEIDGDKAIAGPGGSAVAFVRAYRRGGFTGEIQLSAGGIPDGVVAHCGRILAGESDGCIVFDVPEAMKPMATNLRITGTATDASGKTLTVVGRPWQETYIPGGSRGLWPAEMFTFDVAGPLDITAVSIKPTEITLKPGESKKVEVTIVRAKNFKKNVILDCAYRHGTGGASASPLPTGVTVDDKKSKLQLTGGATSGYLTITAGKDAKPVDKQQVTVLAGVAINFVMKMTYCSQPLTVTISEK